MLEAVDVPLEEHKARDDGKIEVSKKGTLALLEEWLRKYFCPADPKSLESMFTAFRKVRRLRQKPAHAVDEDIFNLDYFKDQRKIMIDAYSALRKLRLVLANYPKVRSNPPEIQEHLAKGEIWDI